MSNSILIENCPFCGLPGAHLHITPTGLFPGQKFISRFVCDSCGVNGPCTLSDDKDNCPIDAAKKWNYRFSNNLNSVGEEVVES